MSISNFIRTLDFGDVVIRKTFTDGEEMAFIELSDSGFASIRKDPNTNQPFAVIFDENCNQVV